MASSTTARNRGVNLNPAQRAAVEHLHGPLLVVAGAGTGKTRVITERVRRLLATLPELNGDNILAITFTDKAAGEMEQRIRRSTDKRGESVTVCTYHAFCLELLRRHGRVRQILDDTDYWIFLRRRLDRLGLDLFKKLSEPGRFLNAFKTFFSRCQDELVSPEDYARYVAGLEAAWEKEKGLLGDEERAAREDHLRGQQEIARAYANAEHLLREADRTTFGGSLLSAVQLLESNPEVLAHYQDRLRYILVDEFQDANIAQIALLQLLAGKHRNLMVVGDDDQAIYRFRGASYASFRKFAELYPDYKKITLTENYRSTGRLLRVATQLIAQNGTARFDPNKKLRPIHPAGGKVRLAEVEDATAEAAAVVREIERLHQATNRYAGIAVLYRAHVHRTALVEALTEAGIPFVIRRLSLLTTPLVRDLLSYLRAINNPRDNISLARLAGMPAWALSPEWLTDLCATAHRKNDPLEKVVRELHPDLLAKQTRLGDLLALLDHFRPRAARRSLTKLFDELLAHLELRPLATDPDALALDTFAKFLRQWEEEKSETKKLEEFIEYFDYFEEAGGDIHLPEDSNNPDAVQLMTVHSAKGLEFDSVFVLRLNRSDFPTPRRHPLFLFPEELMKEALPPGDTHIPEERRLCYVAFTRARRRLTLSTLTGPRKHPSIFLEDIQRDPRVASEVVRLPAAAAPLVLDTNRRPPESQPRLFPARSTSACYSRTPLWARDTRAPQPEQPLALNHSKIETYDRCPLKYKLAEEWKLPPSQNPAMVFGQIMHRSLVEYFRARQRNPTVALEELRHIYDQQWRQTVWPFRDSYQEQGYRASGWQQLEGFYRRQQTDRSEVLDLEKRFRWPLGDVLLTGRIDQINRLRDKAVEIVEYKTGEPRRKHVERSLQLSLYALAAEQHLHLVPERLTLYNLTSNEPISFAPSEKELARAQDRVRQVAARIRAREFPAKTGFHCRYCDYQRICPEYEQSPARDRAVASQGNAPPSKN